MGQEPLVIVEKLVNGRWCYVISGESRREDSEREAWHQARRRLVEALADVDERLSALTEVGR
jgi:hypothetical protein